MYISEFFTSGVVDDVDYERVSAARTAGRRDKHCTSFDDRGLKSK